MEEFKRELFALARKKLQRPGSGGTGTEGAFQDVYGDAYTNAVLQALVSQYTG